MNAPTIEAPVASRRRRLPVKPGATPSARISVRGQPVGLPIVDLTTGGRCDKTTTLASPETSSAEWIADSPPACSPAEQCRPLSLTGGGRTRFTHARAATDGARSGTITDPAFPTTALTLAAGTQLLGRGIGDGGGPTVGGAS